MKNVAITIWMVVAVFVMASGQGFGWVQFKDGGIHNITSIISDDVWVDYLSPEMYTTVNILDGGGVPGGYRLQGWTNSTINVLGGDIVEPILKENSHMNFMGGSVSYAITMYGDSTLLFSGGHINYLLMLENSECLISGSNFLLDGEPVGYGYEIKSVLGGLWQEEPGRNLSGTLANGDNFSLNFRIDGMDASITLVPEPTTLSLLALGAFLLGRKRK